MLRIPQHDGHSSSSADLCPLGVDSMFLQKKTRSVSPVGGGRAAPGALSQEEPHQLATGNKARGADRVWCASVEPAFLCRQQVALIGRWGGHGHVPPPAG